MKLSLPRRGISLWWRSEQGLSVLLISPALLYAIALLAFPLLMVFAFSFWTENYLEIDRTLTLKNYIAVWTEPIYRVLMGRSIIIALSATCITLILAYPIAYYVSFHVTSNKGLWLLLITIPFWTSYLLRVFLWKVILGYNGVLNSSLQWLGIIEQPLTFILYNANAVVITLAHAWAPFAILPIYVALERIDRRLLEAATDLGDGPVRRFLRITLPLSMAGVIAAFLIVFIPTIGDYVTPRLVGGTDGLMIANIVQVQFGKANNKPLGAALAITSIALVTLISMLVVWLNKRYVKGQ